MIEAVAVIGEPLLIAGFDEFGEGRERGGLGIDGVADEADEVSEDLDGIGGGGRFSRCS